MIEADEIHWDRGQLDFIGDAITFMRKADEIELMQSTGLKDKNGQEIFEGDIIDTTDYEGGLSSVGHPFVKVECDKYGFVVTGDFPGSPITLKEFEHGRKFAGVEVTIAGNIYENPDLLEVIK
ncbi:YopX family protein [Streptococcus gordonii]|uniref:YopX family protein n=1 Tax=Streptococcus gordonii TaxID=1302 RepID=UPI00163D501C